MAFDPFGKNIWATPEREYIPRGPSSFVVLVMTTLFAKVLTFSPLYCSLGIQPSD